MLHRRGGLEYCGRIHMFKKGDEGRGVECCDRFYSFEDEQVFDFKDITQSTLTNVQK